MKREATKKKLEPMQQKYACIACLFKEQLDAQGVTHFERYVEPAKYLRTPHDFGAENESEITKKILVHGMWVRCRRCGPMPGCEDSPCRTDADSHVQELLQCSVCGEEKPQADYPTSQWKRRKDKNVYPRCSDCCKCLICEQMLERVEFHTNQQECKKCVKKCPVCLEYYLQGDWCSDDAWDRDQGRCRSCLSTEADSQMQELLKCSVCDEQKPQANYPTSQWKNRKERNVYPRCIDCCKCLICEHMLEREEFNTNRRKCSKCEKQCPVCLKYYL